MTTDKTYRREVPLTGKLITKEDPAMIGTNFQTLKNMRYGRTNPKSIAGHTKVNTTALTNPKIRSGIHFKKDDESHLLVEAYNSGLSSAEIYDNTTAIPGAGDFGSSIFTPTTGADRGRWSLAPDGYVAYCNGEETCVWGGDEANIGGFINYDPSDAFFRDFTDQVSNTISTGTENVATLNRVSQSTTNNMLLLHFENNLTDNSPTTPHTVTNNNITFSAADFVFGAYSAVFNGTTAYASVPDDADFSFTDGTFCVDLRIKVDAFTSRNPIFYQKTDIESVGFTLGTSEIEAGDTITGDASTETAIVDFVDLTSGSWAGGDAAGTIYVHTVSGAFQNEIVNVGAVASATLDGDFSDHGDNYTMLSVETDQTVRFLVHECYGAGSDVIDMSSTTISASTWYHIAYNQNGDDSFIFIDGQQKAQIDNSGERPKNYIGNVLIGSDGSAFYDGLMDEYRVSNIARHTADFEVPSSAYSDAAGGSTDTYLYVGSILPLGGIKFYVSTPNASAATASVSYWDGSDWASVSSFADGTSSGGASLAQTGFMTFDSTASVAKVRAVKGVFLYWYRVIVTAVDDNVGIYHVTLGTPFQKLKDIWDGFPREILSFYKYDGVYNDFTGNIRGDEYDSGDAATFVNVHGLTTAQYLLCGFTERQTGLKINIVGDKGNDTANTNITISYWDGSDWVSVGSVTDDTSNGGISFAQSGLVTWNALSDGVEFTTEFTGAPKEGASAVGSSAQSPSLYYYKISFDKTLSGDASSLLYIVNITGVPAQKKISEYKFPVNAMDRLWLFNDQKGKKNTSVCSSESTLSLFNGDDSYEFIWGDEEEVTASAWLFSQYGSSIFSILLVFKKNEMWALIGNDPTEWQKFQVSSTIGCVAPETLRVIELPSNLGNSANRSSVVIFQGANGVYVTDGRPPVLISEDIGDLFDKKLNKISQDVINESFGFVDYENKEYHWAFAQNGTVDTEFVLDYERMKWFEIDRPVPLQAGFEVTTTEGATYSYGAIDTGFVVHLENGTSFDGSDIASVFQFGDIAPHSEGAISIETRIENHILIAVAKIEDFNITVTYYDDTSSSGSQITYDPNKSGYRLIRVTEKAITDRSLFYSWKFEASTAAEATGFEPLYFAFLYKVIGDYVKEHK